MENTILKWDFPFYGMSNFIYFQVSNLILKWIFNFLGFAIPFQIHLFSIFHGFPNFPIKGNPNIST